MIVLRLLLARCRAWFRRDAIADEIRDEIGFHLQMRAAEFERNGLPPDDARRAAGRQFGNVAVVQDQGYDVRGAGFLESVTYDIRYAVRSLRQSVTFTVVALVVLSLAIGAGAAIFSIVDAVVLRGLPFDEAYRLVAVLGVDGKGAFQTRGTTTPQTYLDWRRLQTSFDGLAMEWDRSFRLTTVDAHPADAWAEQVTWEFFPVLRVAPQLGRLFTPDDEIEGNNHVVILSHGFWQRQFGGAMDVIGKTIELNEQPWQVVGVMASRFEYPVASDRPTDLYVPQSFRTADRARLSNHDYNWLVIGRLKRGVTIGQADEEMNRIARRLDELYPKWEPGRRAHVVTLQDRLVGDSRRWLLMLLAAVGLVLLIACANVANLMLARVTGRTREMAVRATLGASQGRLIRALLIEGVLLSATAASLGTGLAYGCVRVLRGWLPTGIPRVASIAIDRRVLGAEIGVALLTGISFGLVAALHGRRRDLANALRDGARGATSGTASQNVRNALVLLEVALSVVLLVGAGLFIGSFANVMSVDPGFDYHNVMALENVALRFDPSGLDARRWTWTRNDSEEQRNRRAQAYFAELQAAVRRIPGIEMAAVNEGGLPLGGSWSSRDIILPGRGKFTGDDDIDRRRVTPNYLALLKIRLLQGRPLSDEDRAGAPLVALINDMAARKYWPGQNAIGQHVILEGRDRLIVGIVGDIRHFGLEKPPRQELYVPLAQDGTVSARLVMRTTGDPLRVLPAVKAAVWSINPDQHLTQDVYTLEGYLDRLIAQRRFNMALLTLFSVLAIVIAAVGLYGVMAYIVAQRTNEIGVRMALGATPADMVAMVLTRSMVLVTSGMLIGGAGAWQLGALTRSFLFHIEPNDPRILIGALVTLLIVGLIASAVPAWRAAAVDPLTALRQD
jgi:predicted permease